MLVSCEANVNEDMQELDLKKQLIGLEKVHNARQLGGYRIGRKTIKDNLLLRTAKLSEMTVADSTLLSDNYKVQCIYDFREQEESISEPDVHFPCNILFRREQPGKHGFRQQGRYDKTAP